MKIDKNVPIPKDTNKGTKLVYPWPDMKVGDSIFIADKKIYLVQAARDWATRNKPDWSFTGRTVTENRKKGVRIWRIK